MRPNVAPQLRQTSPRAGFGGVGPPAVESAWVAAPALVVFGAVRVMRRLPPHLPRVGPSSRAGRNWHLPAGASSRRSAVAGASSGRVPLPLWMSGTGTTVPSGRSALPAGQDGPVTARIVYTDLDGTMVGPRGSFWHTAGRELTDGPAAALLELHRAGVTLVLVSGRTFEQVVEAARIFAADGAIAELGATIAWDGGRELHRLGGELPDEYTGRTPMAVMAELGVVERLFAAHPGRLEWHAPWHATHETDALLRGRVDPLAVDAWLAEQGLAWLTLKDNGALPPRARTTL